MTELLFGASDTSNPSYSMEDHVALPPMRVFLHTIWSHFIESLELLLI